MLFEHRLGIVPNLAPQRTAATGRGLHNMAERARLVGGKLDVTSAPGRGTSVCLELAL